MAEGFFVFPDGAVVQNPEDSLVHSMGALPYTGDTSSAQMAPQPAAPPAPPEQEGYVPSGPPNTSGMHPIEAQAAERRWLNSMGFDIQESTGRAGREAGFVPMRREGAVDDPYGDERQNLADRERALVRDERDIQFQENELQRGFLAEEQMRVEQRIREQELRSHAIKTDLSRERRDLENEMANHRELINRGVDPWRAYGDGFSGRMAAALALGTMAMAGPEYARMGIDQVNRFMDREVDRQKYEIETAATQVDNAYGRMRDKYADSDQAEAALRALMLDSLKVRLQGLMSETADMRSQQSANEMILEIDKRLMEANDAFYQRAFGKLTEAYDPGQTASAGGRRIVPLDLKDWQSNLESKADVAGREASTAKTWMEREVAAGEGGRDAIVEGIDNTTRERLRGVGIASASFEALFERLGLKADPKTGEVVGELPPGLDAVPGVGLDAKIPGRVFFSKEARLNRSALEKAIYDMSRQDVGANFTGTEKPIVDAFSRAPTEGQQIAVAKQLYKLLQDKKQKMMGGLSTRQRNALMAQESEQNPFNPPSKHGWTD